MPTNDTPILEVLKSIDEGKTALPDFQRGWVWDDEHIKSLLASISLGFPVGAVMMLETGGKDIRFKTRPVEGVEKISIEPELLILDGQQRLTSLYLSTFVDKPVSTRDIKKKPIDHWYYLDIKKCISPSFEREDAIVSIPKDKILLDFRGEVKADYSTADLEYKHEMFPLNIIFDGSRILGWNLGYINYPTDQSEMKSRIEKLNIFKTQILDKFLMYHIPIIKLIKDTPKEAVCQVFEKVNTGGVTLNVFELLTATFAIDEFNLRNDWEENISKHFSTSKYQLLLKRVESTYFLQAVTLLSTFDEYKNWKAENPYQNDAPAVSCRRRDILKMPLEQYKKWKEKAKKGFEFAAQLLHSQKIFNQWDIPYQTQLVPMASILAIKPEIMDSYVLKEKLMRWYWCGVLGELYHGATETRFAKDLVELINWLDGGNEPSTIIDANFAPVRLFSMCTRNSAAYKGISSLLLKSGACDFMNGSSIDEARYYEENMDIHHIFPKQWCIENGIRLDYANCIINKTVISARTNRIIGKKSPSAYTSSITQNHNHELDTTLLTHKINPDNLKKDDFKGFFESRLMCILQMIESAMGKPISGQIAVDTLKFESQFEDKSYSEIEEDN